MIHAIDFFGRWLAPWFYIGLSAFAFLVARKTLANEAKNSREMFGILEAMQANDTSLNDILARHNDAIASAVSAIQQLQAAEMEMKKVILIQGAGLIRAGIIADPRQGGRTIH